jgi:hypothetical protein
MLRFLTCALILLPAWHVLASEPEGASSAAAESNEVCEEQAAEPTQTVEERNQELLGTHGGIWGLMGLSQEARDELNRLVVTINTAVHQNEQGSSEGFAKVREVKRRTTPLTREEYLASHLSRFQLLGISERTRKELLGALEFTWKALHDPTVPEEQREAAIKIRELMKSMGGPPPCCDDGIFERAGMKSP